MLIWINSTIFIAYISSIVSAWKCESLSFDSFSFYVNVTRIIWIILIWTFNLICTFHYPYTVPDFEFFEKCFISNSDLIFIDEDLVTMVQYSFCSPRPFLILLGPSSTSLVIFWPFWPFLILPGCSISFLVFLHSPWFLFVLLGPSCYNK